jgi:hypothetical protein
VPLPTTGVATAPVPLPTPPATSRPCSICESVAAALCCHNAAARCSLGLRSPSGRSPQQWCLLMDTPPRIFEKTRDSLPRPASLWLSLYLPPMSKTSSCPQRPPFRDLPAVEVAFVPLAFRLHTAIAKYRPLSRPAAASRPKPFYRCTLEPHEACCHPLAPAHRSVQNRLPPHRSEVAESSLTEPPTNAPERIVDCPALAELPTLLGFMTSKIVWTPPPKLLRPVHEFSVPVV